MDARLSSVHLVATSRSFELQARLMLRGMREVTLEENEHHTYGTHALASHVHLAQRNFFIW